MVISKLYAGRSICSPNVSPKFGLTIIINIGSPANSLQILLNSFFMYWTKWLNVQKVECARL